MGSLIYLLNGISRSLNKIWIYGNDFIFFSKSYINIKKFMIYCIVS